ncbi:MAG: lipase [Solirubrobacteraceae bacterium]|nr:lipase [Solirubrobacteraceae bacterium]
MSRLPLVVACAALLGLAGPASAADPLPVKYRAPTTKPVDAAAPPAGANDWSCVPSAAHPRPVVLIPSTANTMVENWSALSPLLKNEGYCVFSLNYGAFRAPLGFVYNGGRPVESSADELAAFIPRVLAATGAMKVDLVGHSQGGILAEYYVKFLGGAPHVQTIVGLASPTHGGTLSGLLGWAQRLRRVSPVTGNALWELLEANAGSMLQLRIGSPLIEKLNSVPEPPGVAYTKIASKYDPIATPYRNVFIDGQTNVLLQHKCAKDYADHSALAFDRIALREVRNALDPAHAGTIGCVVVLPFVGG